MKKLFINKFTISCIVVILLLFLIINAKPTIDLNDYLVISFEGYEGYGFASIEIDWDAIQKEYGNKISFKNKQLGENLLISQGVLPLDYMEKYVNISLEKTSNLSTGEEIFYTWNISEEHLSSLNCNLNYQNGAYNVTGLNEMNFIDAFADLDVTISGNSSYGIANVQYLGTNFSENDFSYDKNNFLSNGDVIKISFDKAKYDSYATQGYVPLELEKEYLVSGLNEFISSTSELSETAMKELQDAAYEKVINYSDYQNMYRKITNCTYLGNYFFNKVKDLETVSVRNYLCFVYRIDTVKSNKPTTYFSYVEFRNICTDSEGNCIADTEVYTHHYAKLSSLDAVYKYFNSSYWYPDEYSHENNMLQ